MRQRKRTRRRRRGSREEFSFLCKGQTPWNRLARREGRCTRKAPRLLRCPEHSRRPVQISPKKTPKNNTLRCCVLIQFRCSANTPIHYMASSFTNTLNSLYETLLLWNVCFYKANKKKVRKPRYFPRKF